MMTEAFDWLRPDTPEETGDLAVCWGDARMSNAIFDDSGHIVGLDWGLANKRAEVCPTPSYRASTPRDRPLRT